MKQRDHTRIAYWFPSPRPQRQTSFVLGFTQPSRRLEMGVYGKVTKCSVYGTVYSHCEAEPQITPEGASRPLSCRSTLTILSPPLWRRSGEATKCFSEMALVCEAYVRGYLGDRSAGCRQHSFSSLDT